MSECVTSLSLALYTQNQFRRLVCRTPSIKTSIKKQLLAYKALVKYGLNQEEMENLPPQVAIILKIAKPNIDANIRNYNRRIKNKERKKMSDLKKEVNDKVQLPEREDEFLLGEDFEEPDDNDSLLE